jgi:predicted short-subunit dehydrogenase-like oxidoreductase (DUF2520 family)
MMKVGIIGAGTVGTALAVRLSSRGYNISAINSRTHTSAQRLVEAVRSGQIYDNSQGVADNADFVFITTPDDVIGTVALGTKWYTDQSVVHCSGADSAAVLEPARRAGAQVGSFHPLQTFASFKQAIDNIPGSTFALEAVEPLFSELRKMAIDLDCRWIELKAEDKTAYHIAAVMACNYLVTLVKMATDLWQTFDIPREQAVQALLPLLKGTIHNIETIGIPQCLTGPIARGDIGTITKHLTTLERTAPELLSIYRELGLQTIPISLAKGKIKENQAKELEAILKVKSYIER